MIELENILADIAKDDSIRAAWISSDNPKFFCNGIDAENIVNTPKEKLTDEMGQIVILFGKILSFNKPLLAEVTGYAMGGGAVITLACDFKFMLEGKARIAFTEVLVGLPLPISFIDKLKITVKSEYLNEICLLGTAYKAGEAKEISLINEVSDNKDDLRKQVLKKLDEVMAIAPSAYRRTKDAIHKDILEKFDSQLQFTKDSFENPKVISNLLEAMSALKEKRRPKLT